MEAVRPQGAESLEAEWFCRQLAGAVGDLDSVSVSPHLLSVILAQSRLAISEQSLGTEGGVPLPSNLVAIRLRSMYPCVKKVLGEM